MKLDILHNGNDLSLKLESFTASLNEIDFSVHPLYVGFHKPLKSLYVELSGRNEEDSLVIDYWNGSAFVPMLIEDYTNGLTVSGKINLGKEVQSRTTIGSKNQYWLKLSISSLSELVEIKGINLILSNDRDLSFIPNLNEYLPQGLSSFIGFHQEARDLIVQTLRNSGKKILNYTNLDTRQVSQFDLMDIEEFRNASKYLALHLIFDYLSKSDDDSYRQKADRYFERYESTLNTNLLTLDVNDNGLIDEGENQVVQFIRIKRE